MRCGQRRDIQHFYPKSYYTVLFSVILPLSTSHLQRVSSNKENNRHFCQTPALTTSAIGSIKSRKVLRFNPSWEKRNNADVTKTITRKADRNVTVGHRRPEATLSVCSVSKNFKPQESSVLLVCPSLRRSAALPKFQLLCLIFYKNVFCLY